MCPGWTRARQPLLLLDESHCLRDRHWRCGALANVLDTARAARNSSLPTVVQLVAAGMGATRCGDCGPGGDPAVHRWASPPSGDPVPGRRIGLVWRAAYSRAERFGDFARIIRGAVVDRGLPPVGVVRAAAAQAPAIEVDFGVTTRPPDRSSLPSPWNRSSTKSANSTLARELLPR
jgi:LysR family hydrogen peroxide-inducible transcriptional activator